MMRSMRLFLLVIIAVAFFCGLVGANEDNVNTANSDLQWELSTLNQNVAKLSLDNNQLAARNNAMKTQVLQLQTQLGRLELQGDHLSKKAGKLQTQNPRRAQQIALLEKENLDLNIHSPEFLAAAHRQEESVRLMKMIDDSRQRQKSLHEAIRHLK